MSARACTIQAKWHRNKVRALPTASKSMREKLDAEKIAQGGEIRKVEHALARKRRVCKENDERHAKLKRKAEKKSRDYETRWKEHAVMYVRDEDLLNVIDWVVQEAFRERHEEVPVEASIRFMLVLSLAGLH